MENNVIENEHAGVRAHGCSCCPCSVQPELSAIHADPFSCIKKQMSCDVVYPDPASDVNLMPTQNRNLWHFN